MKVSIKADKRFKDKAGCIPLKIAISHQSETAYLPLDISVLPSQWESRTERVIGHPHKDSLNLTIQQRAFECRARATAYLQQRRGIPTTAAMIRDYCKGDTPINKGLLTDAMERFVNTKKGATQQSYRQTWRKLCEYLGPESALTFDELTVGWLQDWDRWMDDGGLATNARAVHHRNLRAAVNWAIDHDLTTNYPYRRYRIKTEPTAHRDLTAAELRAFMSAPCKPYQRKYQAAFTLIFCLAGINVKDLCHLRKTDYRNGRITYKRAKTGKVYSLKVHPIADGLIEGLKAAPSSPWLLNMLDTNADYRTYGKHLNRQLQRISPQFTFVTTYYARHSIASIAASLQVPRDTIASLLGHTRTVTDIYIHDDRTAADAALWLVIDHTLQP